MILTFVKNCKGQMLLDQNRSKILEESMRCSFLVKFVVQLATLLLAFINSFNGIALVFFVLLRNTNSGKHFLVAVPFYVNCETHKLSRKPLKIEQIKRK